MSIWRYIKESIMGRPRFCRLRPRRFWSTDSWHTEVEFLRGLERYPEDTELIGDFNKLEKAVDATNPNYMDILIYKWFEQPSPHSRMSRIIPNGDYTRVSNPDEILAKLFDLSLEHTVKGIEFVYNDDYKSWDAILFIEESKDGTTNLTGNFLTRFYEFMTKHGVGKRCASS